jgi:putative hydrolase of the HAD superfamily
LKISCNKAQPEGNCVSSDLHPLLRDARAVLFDAGGTLVHPDWSRLARLAEAETGRTFAPEEMRRMLYEALRLVDAKLSTGNGRAAHTQRPGWLFRDMFCALGVDEESCERMSAPMLAEHERRHLWCDLDPEAANVIAELKRAGLRVGVISNTEDGRARETIEEIADEFDLLVDSFMVGLRKPDAAIFHHALEQLNVAPHEAVYVGDSYGHDVLGARSAGLKAILLDPLDFYTGSDCPRIHALKELTEDAGC